LGLRVCGLGLRMFGLGVRVWGLGFRVEEREGVREGGREGQGLGCGGAPASGSAGTGPPREDTRFTWCGHSGFSLRTTP